VERVRVAVRTFVDPGREEGDMSVGDEITVQRDCDAILIPSGVFTALKEGTRGYLTQTLGGSFTLQLNNGELARVSGMDADALGLPVPEEAKPKGEPGKDVTVEAVWDVMKTCYDPEIPVNIVDLGLIYECKVEPRPEGGAFVKVVMTLTAPGCGMSDILKNDIETKVRQMPGVGQVQVDVAFEPPWDASRMTDAARLQLGIL
jgi:probable FeS assembly SUF system protein SufT